MNEIIMNKHEYFKNENIMEAILKFTLPEEQYEFMVASKASNLAYVISELDRFLRSKSKYEGINKLGIDELREEIRRLCEENNVFTEVVET